MKYILKTIKKQKETVEGTPIDIDGEIIMLGALDEEEKAQMIKEGQEMAEITTTVEGKEVKLGEIENGQLVIAITDMKQYEGNYTGFWYVWRARKIMKAFKKLTPKAQEQLKVVLAKKGLDVYLEDI